MISDDEKKEDSFETPRSLTRRMSTNSSGSQPNSDEYSSVSGLGRDVRKKISSRYKYKIKRKK